MLTAGSLQRHGQEGLDREIVVGRFNPALQGDGGTTTPSTTTPTTP